MPTLNLFTNVPVDAVVASDILKDCTKAVAKIIGKPESVGSLLPSPFSLLTSHPSYTLALLVGFSACFFVGFVCLCNGCYMFDDITLSTWLFFQLQCLLCGLAVLSLLTQF